MRVVLINPPKTEWERDEIAPPLGLLRLAEVARQAGASVAVEDYNLLYHLHSGLRQDFYKIAVERLEALDADVYGFTSMAVDSHVALELARRLKQSNPRRVMVFGGPHFSSLAEVLPQRYSWVDCVIRGEGERAFEELLRRMNHKTSMVVLSEKPATSGLPQPAYSLVQLSAYFHVNPQRLFNFEANRGCRYKCTFCYSPGFYGMARDFGVDQVIEELAGLHALGARRVFFVGDNLLNNRAWVARLCAELTTARLGIDWYCYATLPDLTEDLAGLMGRAGCTQVFMGIDVVGRTSERHFHKAFLRRETDLEHRIRAIRDQGVEHPTCGFILCPPSHPGSSDWASTVDAALRARRAGAQVLFNTLNLYAGTEAYRYKQVRHEPDSLQARLLMDVPAIVEENEYAVGHPDGFPFHSRYVPADEWRDFLQMAHCLHTLVNSFPDELSSIWEESEISPMDFAHRVVERTGDLLRLQVQDRRRAEQNQGLAVIDALGAKHRLDAARQAAPESPSEQGFW